MPYNSVEALEALFEKIGEKIAGVIVEPVAGNMGVILPRIEFIRKLRELTVKFGSVLIFDEVITGLRLYEGSVQSQFNVTTDLVCLGKIIGGGLPIGAVGGKKEIMELLAPVGPVYQAGTLSGNPVSVSSGIATLKVLKDKTVYDKLENSSKKLEEGIKDISRTYSVPISVVRFKSLLTVYFSEKEPENLEDVRKSKVTVFPKLFKAMFENGVLLPPSQYEAWFISLPVSENELSRVLNVFEKFVKENRGELL